MDTRFRDPPCNWWKWGDEDGWRSKWTTKKCDVNHATGEILVEIMEFCHQKLKNPQLLVAQAQHELLEAKGNETKTTWEDQKIDDFSTFQVWGRLIDSSTSGALELMFLKENKQWKFAINNIKSFNIKPWTCEIITTIFKNKLWTSRNNNSISNDVNMWRFDGFLGPPGSL